MTQKLFWKEPYRTQFDAAVVREYQVDNGFAVVLDQTCFYATSGGQPCDAGTLNGIPVVDVRIEKDQILHITQQPVGNDKVEGVIDWQRRFDHMQQHSGQHILSAAFFNLFQAETSSFHLGDEYCSIELGRHLSDAQVSQAEEAANQVLFKATAVTTFFVDPAKADEYPLRKKSDLAEALRLVQVGDFDLSPCSGTHVSNAAEVGLIFVTGVERLSQSLRVAFLCGNRVRVRYKKDLVVLKTLSKTLTTSHELLPESVTKMQMQIKDMRKQLSQMKQEQLKAQIPEIIKNAHDRNGKAFVFRVSDEPYDDLRFLAQLLAKQPAVLGALASVSDRRIVFFKHPDVDVDVKKVFADFQAETKTRGGGPPHFMEAGNWPAETNIEELLKRLFTLS